MRRLWTGCGTALVTPFTRDGALDEAGVRRLARRQIDAGMHFLVPCGTTGESPTLSDEERLRVVALVVEEAAGRVPVLAGAGGYDTREVDSNRADDEAARRRRHPVGDAVLQQADAGRPLPALCRDRRRRRPADRRLQRAGPHRLQRDLATLVRLAEMPNIIGVKEASGNVCRSARSAAPCRATSSCSPATMR